MATKQGRKDSLRRGQRVQGSTWIRKVSETLRRKSNPPSDHCKGVVTQETITWASSLIPNETFRYQVKFLALVRPR